jgi:hypothetical protein
MTPLEKAEELIKKFTFNTRCFSETKGWEDYLYDAKQCALIAVDKILIEIRKIYDIYTEINIINIYQYWQEVKEEIEKL